MNATSKLACYGLVLGAATACATLRPAATPRRAAVSATACEDARAVAAERADLVGVLAAIGAGSAGAGINAYDAANRTPSVATAPSATAPQPGGTASAAATTAAIHEMQMTVAIWAAEAARSDAQGDPVREQIGRLDQRARTLPTVAACGAVGADGGRAAAGTSHDDQPTPVSRR